MATTKIRTLKLLRYILTILLRHIYHLLPQERIKLLTKLLVIRTRRLHDTQDTVYHPHPPVLCQYLHQPLLGLCRFRQLRPNLRATLHQLLQEVMANRPQCSRVHLAITACLLSHICRLRVSPRLLFINQHPLNMSRPCIILHHTKVYPQRNPLISINNILPLIQA